MFGRENHLIGCQNLISYVAPGKDFVPMKKPFSKEESKQFYLKEVKAIKDQRKKRKLDQQWKRYVKNMDRKKQKSRNRTNSIECVHWKPLIINGKNLFSALICCYFSNYFSTRKKSEDSVISVKLAVLIMRELTVS